jgi:hypothetical protein
MPAAPGSLCIWQQSPPRGWVGRPPLTSTSQVLEEMRLPLADSP